MFEPPINALPRLHCPLWYLGGENIWPQQISKWQKQPYWAAISNCCPTHAFWQHAQPTFGIWVMRRYDKKRDDLIGQQLLSHPFWKHARPTLEPVFYSLCPDADALDRDPVTWCIWHFPVFVTYIGDSYYQCRFSGDNVFETYLSIGFS